MKKRYIGSAVIAGLLVAPYFAGMVTKNKMYDLIAQLPAQPNMEFQIENYHQGWFNSSADFSVNISQEIPEQGITLEISIVSKQEMQHGPILWQANGLGFGLVDINFDFDINHNLPETSDFSHDFNTEKFESWTRVNLLGKMTSKMMLAQTSIQNEDTQITVKPISIHSSITLDGKLEFDGLLEGIEIQELNGETFTIGKTTFTGDQQVARGDIFKYNAITLGKSEAQIDYIKLQSTLPSQSINIESLEVVSNSYEKDSLMFADVGFTVDSIDAIGQKFTAFDYQVAINKISLDAYENLQAIMVNQTDPEQMLTKMQATLPELLASGPNLKISNLGVSTAQGDIKSDLNITFDESLYQANNPMSMILALKADANGKAPIEFFETLGMDENIEMLLIQNLLVQEQTNVKFHFTFENGQGFINDMPMPLGF